jgi:Na+:H+ antiporter
VAEQDLSFDVLLFVAGAVVAAVVGIVSRRTPVPYTVALVLVGLIGARILVPQGATIPPDLVLLVLLPGLVFEAAYRIELGQLRRTFGGILFLAAPGVLLTAAVVAFVLQVATGMPLELGFVVGAMVSATDPAAVVATFKRLGAPPALSTLVDGESLFNDGTGIVVFLLALKAVDTGIGPIEAIDDFVVAVVGSTVLGAGVGLIASRALRYSEDHLVELTISLAAAYGTYIIADDIGLSGVIATVVAGVVLGNYGRRTGLSSRAEEAVDIVWEFIAFLSTALAFLLVGVATSVPGLLGALPWIVWAVVAVEVGRAVVVYPMLGGVSHLLGRRAGRSIPTSWLHVLFWSGLRGAVAVAMALSLPVDFPQRQLLQEITFGVALFTLLVQGTTIERVMRLTRAAEAGAQAGIDDEPGPDGGSGMEAVVATDTASAPHGLGTAADTTAGADAPPRVEA